MNMIERVARAMCKSDDPENDWNSKAMSDYSRNAWRVYATAAIEAMREPTDLQRNEYFKEMQASGWSNGDSVFDDATWERMIDAALKEK